MVGSVFKAVAHFTPPQTGNYKFHYPAMLGKSASRLTFLLEFERKDL